MPAAALPLNLHVVITAKVEIAVRRVTLRGEKPNSPSASHAPSRRTVVSQTARLEGHVACSASEVESGCVYPGLPHCLAPVHRFRTREDGQDQMLYRRMIDSKSVGPSHHARSPRLVTGVPHVPCGAQERRSQRERAHVGAGVEPEPPGTASLRPDDPSGGSEIAAGCQESPVELSSSGVRPSICASLFLPARCG
jgi:hypothetical protein